MHFAGYQAWVATFLTNYITDFRSSYLPSIFEFFTVTVKLSTCEWILYLCETLSTLLIQWVPGNANEYKCYGRGNSCLSAIPRSSERQTVTLAEQSYVVKYLCMYFFILTDNTHHCKKKPCLFQFSSVLNQIYLCKWWAIDHICKYFM